MAMLLVSVLHTYRFLLTPAMRAAALALIMTRRRAAFYPVS
jgi:hypothetical protein